MKKLLFCASVLAMAACSGNSSDELLYSLDYLPVEAEGRCFFIDVTTGQKAENSGNYYNARFFYNDIAIVYDDPDQAYFIDKNFERISNSTYYDVTYFNDGVAYAVEERGHIEAINTSGEVVFTLEEAEKAYRFHDGVSVFLTVDDEYGLVNTKGEILIEPGEYDKMNSEYGHGLLPVAVETKKGLRWGAVTYDGKEVISCEYDQVRCADENLLYVCDDDTWGVVDGKNKEIIPIEYKKIYRQPDGNYLVEKYIKSKDESRWGWLDSEGNEMIAPSYSSAYIFTNVGLAPAKSPSDEEYGFIDENGEWVIEPAYESAFSFNDENISVVENSRGKWGLINEKGEYVLSARYDFIYYMGEGLYIVEKDDMYGIINKLGEAVTKMSDELDYKDPYEAIRENSEVTSDYFDIDDVVNKMVADAKQLMVDDLSLSAFENKFNTTLNSYSWATLASSKNKYYHSSVEAYVDYGYDYEYDYDYRRYYYITKFRVEFDIDSYKLSRNSAVVAEKFAEAINAEALRSYGTACEWPDTCALCDSSIVEGTSARLGNLEDGISVQSILPNCTAQVRYYDWLITMDITPKYGVIR